MQEPYLPADQAQEAAFHLFRSDRRKGMRLNRLPMGRSDSCILLQAKVCRNGSPVHTSNILLCSSAHHTRNNVHHTYNRIHNTRNHAPTHLLRRHRAPRMPIQAHHMERRGLDRSIHSRCLRRINNLPTAQAFIPNDP